jgi:cytochrome c-type protein NapB
MSDSPAISPTGLGRKLATVAAVAAVTVGTSGYFMALRQADRAAERLRPATDLEYAAAFPSSIPAVDAPVAPHYLELAGRDHHPNRDWRSTLATLAPPPPFDDSSPGLTPAELQRLLAERSRRRAFNGAPPTVPHPVDPISPASCLACHGRPTRIGTRDVPQMSHAPFSQCLQCHAPAAGPAAGFALLGPDEGAWPEAAAAAANLFEGLAPPAAGRRAYPGAPPLIPHTTLLRDNCLSGHGPGGSSAIKTTHPQRTDCRQCHAVDATQETLPLLAGPPPPHHP